MTTCLPTGCHYPSHRKMSKATKAEREWMGRVAALSCIVCRTEGLGDTPAMVHHIGNGTMGKRASNYETIPLCSEHHQYGGHGVAVHAGRKAFEARYGTEQDLLEQTGRELGI